MSDPSPETRADTSPTGAMDVPHATLLSLFWLFFQIGSMSFGGGLMAWVYREVVEKRGWLSAADVLSGTALAQVLPGVNITNMSIYVGQRLRGALGAVVSLIGLLTAPFFMIIGLAAVYAQIDSIPWAHNFMAGVATAAVGLVLSVTLKSIRAGIRGVGPVAVLIAVFVGVGVLHWHLLLVAGVLAPVSVALAWYAPSPAAKGKSDA